jgi:hypothetical protein
MLADVFTKLLQGSAFHKFRDAILNVPLPSDADSDRLVSAIKSQECVEECDVDDSLADARKDIKHGQVVVKDETSGGDKM